MASDTSKEPQSEPISKPAGHPFNHPGADIILRSSDTEPVDFHVFKLLLSLASPFFELAFTLPQTQGSQDGMPVIEMSEDKHTLELVLRLCYPTSMEEPLRLSSLHDLQVVLEAAVKLEMEGIQKYVRKVLMEPRFIGSQPLRVFAIAYRRGWIPEAKKAARISLRYSTTTPFVNELEHISAAVYYRLQEYHKKCGDIAASHVLRFVGTERFKHEGEKWVWTTCLNCSRAPPAKGNATSKRGTWDPSRPGTREWWVDWMKQVADELRKTPWGDTVKKYDLMMSGVARAKECSYCRKGVVDDLELFSHVLAVQIENAISEVKLQFSVGGSNT